MRLLAQSLILAVLAMNLAACGTKGKLKSPSQIEAEQQKKARKAAKQKQEAEKAKAAEQPAPAEAAPEQ